MKFSKNFLWSKLIIDIKDNKVDNNIIDLCFKNTEIFENTYSRFIKGNFLYNLNKYKKSDIDWDFYTMVNLAINTSKLTEWYFDITIWPILEQMWYWKKNVFSYNNIWYKNILLTKSNIILNNNISIDLWSLWKWYILDKINSILSKYYNNYIINFGWDIICKWKYNIWLENPKNISKIIWTVEMKNISISSSSWLKRTFNNNHHLINPYNKQSENNKLAIYVTHKLAVFSDIFSTALFVAPLKISLTILNNTPGLEWLIIDNDWKYYKSKGFDCSIF